MKSGIRQLLPQQKPILRLSVCLICHFPNTPSAVMHLRLLSHGKLRLLAGLSFCLIGVFSVDRALAAEQIVFKYQALRESLTVNELATFAKTGKASPKIDVYLKLSQSNPKEIRQALTNEVVITPAAFEDFINSWVGKLILDEFSRIVRPTARQPSKQSLRTAIARSITSDGKFNMVEVLQNYPATQVEFDVDRLIETDRRINAPT